MSVDLIRVIDDLGRVRLDRVVSTVQGVDQSATQDEIVESLQALEEQGLIRVEIFLSPVKGDESV